MAGMGAGILLAVSLVSDGIVQKFFLSEKTPMSSSPLFTSPSFDSQPQPARASSFSPTSSAPGPAEDRKHPGP